MDKRQFLEQTINSIRQIELDTIIERYIALPRKSSSNYLGICPFHNDTRLGSFVVSPKKGIFKCFACDKGGDAIKFVSLFTGKNYVEAAFEVALQEGIISYSEYDEYFKKKRYYKNEIKAIEQVYVNLDNKKNESFKASPVVTNKIFEIFLSHLKISDKHRKYLNETRGISDELIEKRLYKSYPTPSAMSNLIKELNGDECKNNPILKGAAQKGRKVAQDNDISFVDAILSTIPGFFQKKSKGKWEWQFPFNKGILMPIRNASQEIVGLQIRRDEKKEGGVRYFWFSSSFALYNEKFRYGTPSGSPIDVVYTEDEPNQVLFITEGRFKSEVIANKINSTSISIQGVSSWREIDKEIEKAEKNILKRYPNFEGFKCIFIAFDSDMRYKYQVYEQLKKMSDYLKKSKMNIRNKNVGIWYLHWESEKKGIDDLLISETFSNRDEYKSLFDMYRKEYWDIEYDKQLKALIEEESVESAYDLSQEKIKNGIIIKKERIAG